MLNTLANHNFLPHSGKDITEQVMVNALTSVLNFAPKLSKALFKFGKRTNPNRNITVISLDRLGIHNILEHDASLRYVHNIRKVREVQLKCGILVGQMISLTPPTHSTKPSSTKPLPTGQVTPSLFPRLLCHATHAPSPLSRPIHFSHSPP